MGVDTILVAGITGRALAYLHWSVRMDGGDVEFVLGGAPLSDYFFPKGDPGAWPREGTFNKGRKWYLWLLDFDKSDDLSWGREGMKRGARACEDNDPYFPRQVGGGEGEEGWELWEAWKGEYVLWSGRLIEAWGVRRAEEGRGGGREGGRGR